MAYPRRQYQNSKRKRNYRTSRSTKMSQPRAKISQNGVGGAANSMVPRPMPPPQEVKTFDIDFAGTMATTPIWVLCSSANVNIGASFVSGIIPGSNQNNRIGRQIRVVGVVLRGLLTIQVGAAGSEGGVSTMDVIWDRQPNGAVPTINTIYDPAGAANAVLKNLPNADFSKRFTFAKRLQVSGRAGTPTASQIIDASIKCNRLVSYDSVAANAASVEQNSLLISYVATQAASSVSGVVRFLYVDA